MQYAESTPLTREVAVIRPARWMMLCLCLGLPGEAWAQRLDLTIFLGRAFPVADDRLTLRPGAPSLPGVDASLSGDPRLEVDGGPVIGAALAVEFGVFAVEGRLDATEVGFDLAGGRYDLRATTPALHGLAGNVTLGDGRFDADRLNVLSLNARLRTPGPVGLVISGGYSYLPAISITGSVPVSVAVAGVTLPAGVQPQVRLVALPGQSEHRFGVNAGAGLRIGGNRVAVIAEARAFYFREYELTFAVDNAPAFVNNLLGTIEPVGFEPVLVNAQVGLVLRF